LLSFEDIAMTKQLLTRESEMKNCQNNMDIWKRMVQAAPMNCAHKKYNNMIIFLTLHQQDIDYPLLELVHGQLL
jgi:hypothetical protein